jgi:hypothetical protein
MCAIEPILAGDWDGAHEIAPAGEFEAGAWRRLG